MPEDKIVGQLVDVLGENSSSAETYTLQFNAQELPSGIYIYQLYGNNVNISRKMILMK